MSLYKSLTKMRSGPGNLTVREILHERILSLTAAEGTVSEEDTGQNENYEAAVGLRELC